MLRRTAFVLSVLALAPAARAEEPLEGAVTRELRASLGASLNPAGLQNGFDLSWTHALSASKSPLRADAHLAAGLSSRLTPAYVRIGPWMELAPLSVFDVRAGVEAIGYFGTFHSLLAFQGYGDPFDDDTRKARDGAKRGLGTRAFVAPSLKARAGPVVFRARVEFEWWTVNAPGPYVYEPYRDTLLRSEGDGVVATETILLWSTGDEPRGLMVGPVHEMTLVYDSPENRRQLAGLVAVWRLGERRLGFAKPVVYAKAGRYVEEPNRHGRVTVQLGVSVGLDAR